MHFRGAMLFESECLEVQQTPRKGIVDVVKERFKEAYRRRDAGDISKHR